MSEHLYAQVLSRPSSDTDQAQIQTRPALGFMASRGPGAQAWEGGVAGVHAWGWGGERAGLKFGGEGV